MKKYFYKKQKAIYLRFLFIFEINKFAYIVSLKIS